MAHVLFLCLGNICRSPMAEAVFQRLVDDTKLSDVITVDSAGTGSWHVGQPAHRGAREILRQNGIKYRGRARQISSEDVERNPYVVAMSESNADEFRRRFGSDYPRLYRLLQFAAGSSVSDVPDPYYTGNFDYVYELVEEGCHGLLEFIRNEENF